MDTNLLVRVAIEDDVRQTRAARKLLDHAESIAIPIPCLCELVWVLRSGYKIGRSEVESVLRTVLDADNIVTDRQAVAAGIETLQAGGDFADGVIAYEGRWMGGEVLYSFDRKAVAALMKTGQAAELLE